MHTRFYETHDKDCAKGFSTYVHTFNTLTLTGCTLTCVQCLKNNTLIKNMKNAHTYTHIYCMYIAMLLHCHSY